MGRALPVKYSEYFGAKRCESLKNENIRYDNIYYTTMLWTLTTDLSTYALTFRNTIRISCPASTPRRELASSPSAETSLVTLRLDLIS